MSQSYVPPARTAHGVVWWLLVGWYWAPAKWLGRVLLWVLFFPLGLWRSIVHGRNTRDAKTRRGYQRS